MPLKTRQVHPPITKGSESQVSEQAVPGTHKEIIFNSDIQPERNKRKGHSYIIIGVIAMLGGGGIALSSRIASVFSYGHPDIPTAIILVLVGIAIATLGIKLASKGKKLATPYGDQIIRDHARPLVLYLRSFNLDVEDGKNEFPIYMGVSVPINPWETSLALAFSKVSDMIAIGKPGEEFATTGAARVYVTDDQWKDKVIELLDKSEIVVWTYGATEGLKWEIRRLVENIPPQKLVVALPFWQLKASNKAKAWSDLKESINHIFPKPLPDELGESLFVTFDENWNASAVTPMPAHPMIRAAGMFIFKNQIIDGVNGLLAIKGFTWPATTAGVLFLASLGIAAWVIVLSTSLVMLGAVVCIPFGCLGELADLIQFLFG